MGCGGVERGGGRSEQLLRYRSGIVKRGWGKTPRSARSIEFYDRHHVNDRYSIHYDCVAAAGNDGTDTKIYLASYSPAVIAVSAVKETGNIRWVNISRIAWSGR